MSNSSNLVVAALSALSSLTGVALPKFARNDKSRPEFSKSELQELKRLFNDKSNPKRKSEYKKYLAQLRADYGK